ncbi:MAG: RDD family protein [Pseudonocardiales bacterium]
MSQPPDDPFLRPPPPQRPYGAPYGGPPTPTVSYPPPGYGPPRPPSGFQPPPGYVWGTPPQAVAPDGTPLAGPGWRLLARIIDGFIVSLISAPFALPLYISYFRHILDKVQASTDAAQAGQPAPNLNVYDATTIKLIGLITLIGIAVALLYEVPQLAVWGQTVGKRICNVRVVRMGGSPRLGFGSALLRWIATYAGSFVPVIGSAYALADYLWLLWDRPYQQCLHDKFAKTVVVKAVR